MEPGSIVADRYRLGNKLGEGAMGAVFSAEHLTLGSRVALKFVKTQVLTESESQARFVREARLSATLGEASRHITRVFDFGVLPNGTPYLAMELLCGESLAERLEREPQLPLPLVEHIVVQLCRALEVAHGANIVHRDLKPANIFLQESKEDAFGLCVKLLDFGVAKNTGLSSQDQDATVAGVLIGTPKYMSPEHFDCAFDPQIRLDRRADLWSCAAIIYRMIVGVVPFDGESLTETMRLIAIEPFETICQRSSTTPPALDEWFNKAFSKDPQRRFQSAPEFAAAFVAAVKNGQDASVPSAVGIPLPAMRAPGGWQPSRAMVVASTLLFVTLCVLSLLRLTGVRRVEAKASASAPRISAELPPRPSMSIANDAVRSPPKRDVEGAVASTNMPTPGGSASSVVVPSTTAVRGANSASRPSGTTGPVSRAMKKADELGESKALWNKKDEL